MHDRRFAQRLIATLVSRKVYARPIKTFIPSRTFGADIGPSIADASAATVGQADRLLVDRSV